MKCNVRKGIRMLLVLVLVFSLFLTTGCTVKPEPGQTLSGQTQPSTDPSATDQTQPDDTDGSLVLLRQAMIETPQLFAVAYFGVYAEDPYAAMQEATPGLCENLPFLLDIPEDRVIGQGGDLFCIVPADENATVAVSTGYWDEDNQQAIYDNMIYSSSTGEPILLFCNNDGWEPDTQVYISGESGEVFWYPQIDDNRCAMPIYNDNEDKQFLDFSNYTEILQGKHRQMQEIEWVLPTAEMLIGTTWCWDGYLLDGREVFYQVVFEEEILSVRWNNGMDDFDLECLNVPWELTEDQGFAVLTMDFGGFADIRSYNILYHETFNQLYVAMDLTQEALPVGSEPLYRILSRPVTPEPVEMIGTWELAWIDVEGDRTEADPNERTIQIQSAASGGLLMSYTSQQFPDNDFQNEPLTIDMRQMHILCGNDEWVADVDYVGPWDTTYTITLTTDDILIKQNYFLTDGAPSVSYEYFRRAQ